MCRHPTLTVQPDHSDSKKPTLRVEAGFLLIWLRGGATTEN